jgi:hypothetical protein
MSQALRIYVSSLTPAWEELLLQCGLWFEPLPPLDTIDHNDASAILITSPVSSSKLAWFQRWCHQGGALLDVGNHLSRYSAHTVNLRFLVAGKEEAVLFPEIWALDLYSDVMTLTGAELWGGTVALSTEGKGTWGVLGFDPAALWMDTRRARKRFYRHEGHSPNEVVSLVSKHHLTHLLLGCLRWLHSQRGLPLARLSPFPDNAPTVFTMRMDSDYGDIKALQHSMTRAEQYGVKLTWFLHLEPLQHELGELWKHEGHEWALHGWKHETYPDYNSNARHLLKGLKFLEDAGKSVSGVSAPFGIWNTGWQQAVEDSGFLYSSEFGFAGDGFPIRPVLDGKRCSSWQLPVHPVCPGSLMRIAAAPEEHSEYLCKVLRRKLAVGEPAAFYHHPLHHLPKVEEALYSMVGELGLPCMTYSEWLHWWRQRIAQKWSAWWENEGVSVAGVSRSIPLLLERDEQNTRLFESGFHPSPLWKSRTFPFEHKLPEDWRRCRESRIDLVEHSMQDLFHLMRQNCDVEGHRRVAVDIGEWSVDFNPSATAFDGF